MSVKNHQYFVYIMSSHSGTLYIGMTNSVYRRALEHKSGQIDGFASKYGCIRRVHYESFDDVHQRHGTRERTERLDPREKDSLNRIQKSQVGRSGRALGSANAVRR
jgi:predicted GIY-YIG superfamily endonuclease